MEKINFGNLCVLSTHNLEDKSLPIIVIESAVVPRKIKEYLDKYLHIRLVVSPEFLTAKESFERFLNPDCRILGGEKDRVNKQNEGGGETVKVDFKVGDICYECQYENKEGR